MRIIFWTIVVLMWFSCKPKEARIPIPNVDDIDIEMTLHRYENELIHMDTNQIEEDFQRLKTTFPSFTDLYFQNIVPLNQDAYGTEFQSELRELLADSRFRNLVDTINQIFPDFENTIGRDLEKAFKNYKYYFPEFTAPVVYTLVSEFAYQMFLFEEKSGVEGLGIGLDLFMGKEFPYQKIAPGLPSFSDYLTRTFTKEHIVRKAIKTLLDDRWPIERNRTLLDFMVENGKKLYVLNRILPEIPDSILLEYSADQVEWVRENEIGIWSYFFSEELFYETNMLKINKYINPSPNSPGMPPRAPGRTGNYIGWKIVNAYMERHPETTLQQLIDLDDAQKIMDESRYKPKPGK